MRAWQCTHHKDRQSFHHKKSTRRPRSCTFSARWQSGKVVARSLPSDRELYRSYPYRPSFPVSFHSLFRIYAISTQSVSLFACEPGICASNGVVRKMQRDRFLPESLDRVRQVVSPLPSGARASMPAMYQLSSIPNMQTQSSSCVPNHQTNPPKKKVTHEFRVTAKPALF